MIQDFVIKFDAARSALKDSFSARHPEDYRAIVKAVITAINPSNEYGLPDPERIYEIDDGHYQGTLIYVIAESGYQPDSYWYVKVDYGSCSGCDTLEAIREYDDDPPTEQQADDYLTLALHIVQRLKRMDD